MKRVLAILLLAGSFFSVSARTPDGFIGRVSDMLTRPNPRLDTNYIAHPVYPWTVSLRNDLFRTGTNVDMDILYDIGDGDDIRYRVRTGLYSPLAVKTSLYLSYGALKLGYGLVIGKKGAASSNSFSLLRPAYGLSLQYYRIKGKPEVSYFDEDGKPSDPYIPEELATMYTVSADTYYAFNNKRYIYNATYTAYHLQKKTAGSFLLTGKYQYGDLKLPMEDPGVMMSNEGIGRFRTHQFSLGFGYGFNWVPFHRDATGGDPGTLRNFTANVTFVPMAVVSNRMFYTKYVLEDLEVYSVREKDSFRLWGGLGFDMIARCALCYTFGRYSLGATFNYNRFSMVGTDKYAPMEGETFTSTMTNHFYDWSTSLRFDYRF